MFKQFADIELPSEDYSACSMKEIVDRLDVIIIDLEAKEQSGNEGLRNVVVKILNRILNMFMHVLNTFKTNTLEFMESFRRSETRYFKESYAASFRGIMNAKYTEVARVPVNEPEGMVKPYEETIPKLRKLLDDVDLVNKVELIKDLVTSMYKQIGLNAEIKGILDDTYKVIDQKVVDKQFKEYQSLFGKSKRKDADQVFGQNFKNMKSFDESIDHMLKAEIHFKQTKQIADGLDEITNLYNGIIRTVEEDLSKITTTDIKRLAQITRAQAVVFELYGVLTHDLSRVDHNVFLTLDRLRDALSV